MIIDTHSHLYLEDFNDDILQVIERSKKAGVEKIVLPNIDDNSLAKMHNLLSLDPKLFYPCIGLHPTSVKENYKEKLDNIFSDLNDDYIAIGETGIDLYWDKTFFKEQQRAFEFQIEIALKHILPVIIHSRNSLEETFEIVFPYSQKGLKAVFHCFPGNYEDAKKIVDKGFYIGIGGVVTFKNSGLHDVVKKIPINNILLETDAPFLAPVPYRGRRNEPAYLETIVQKIEEITVLSSEKIKEITSKNAIKFFNFKQ